ncbi:MAG: type II toxin-antitoxin system death-on-curing family toxin [Thaumarchaeota archaeon]|nr:type II toxin-antitoxin system death-on-curing family toxin [Nitrososphaerota archaeon]
MIDRFGGTSGVLNEGTVDYAVHKAAGRRDIIEEAAILLTIVAQEHPFLDGNKRTAIAVAETLLRLNRIHLKATNEEVFAFVFRVAQGKLNRTAVTSWLKTKVKKEP